MQPPYKDPPPPYSADPLPGVHQHYGYYTQTPASAPPAQQFYAATPNLGPSYGATQNTTILVQEPEVIIIGACPACRIGVLEEDFTCLGVLCAILFFPLGLLCCLLLREKKCSNCGASFERY